MYHFCILLDFYIHNKSAVTSVFVCCYQCILNTYMYIQLLIEALVYFCFFSYSKTKLCKLMDDKS